jgi:hypothetical protein
MNGCIETDDLLTENAQTGGLVEPQAAAINYLVGDVNAEYSVTVLVPQGEVKTTAIEVWAKFTNALGTGDMGLLLTIPVENDVNSSFATGTFTYQDLRAATTQADGSPLPEDDIDLVIGNGWTLIYRGITTAGNFINASTTNLGVATRFAGTYNVIDKDYWRVGVDRSDLDGLWPATMDVISIDIITYELLEWWGLFDGNELFFTIDPVTLEIDYPEPGPNGPQTGNGQPITTCDANPGDLTNVFCDDPLTNTAEKVDPSGADILRMAWGYFTAGSGPREFYQVLEKVVD